MSEKTKSVLVIGFNTRPIAQSLYNAGYDVYAVDFFGDLDLYPYIKDCSIITKELETNYSSIKDNYGHYLAKLTIDLLRKYPHIDYLIIGSGLDDNLEERELILNEINKGKYHIRNLSNDLEIIKKARNILEIYNFLRKEDFKVPNTYSLDIYNSLNKSFKFPYILKKKKGAGGINVYKLQDKSDLANFIQIQGAKGFNESDWLIQEYIEGIPVSCTTISNGKECEIISINRQIIGENFLNSPKEFMYCGNVVPANLYENDNTLISQISKRLANHLNLKGINGFDYVLKNHYPYLMEINPRIPGSISASEAALDLNLLTLYIDSFEKSNWDKLRNTFILSKLKYCVTKLIMFAPKDINIEALKEITNLEHVYDKTEPVIGISKNDPLCTVLYKGDSFSESYFGALKIIDKIKEIINQ